MPAFLRRLCRSAITQNRPVFMITVDASDLTRLALQEAGATAVLTKPINVPALEPEKIIAAR
ncbi:hypothetical protein GIW43_27110 [Pseudomonas canadensis]|nr:hypothetical protein [Pseudomonas canadensis]